MKLDAECIVLHLQRHGYEARLPAPGCRSVVVRDPVMALTPGGGSRRDYKDVKIADWAAARRFVEVRS